MSSFFRLTEGEEPVDQTINKPPLAMPVKSLMWIPAYGDIVWVQTLSSFPFWPACVMDPSTLPTETQAMTAALLRVSSSNNSARVSPATVKKALFLYGSAHYDFATPLQVTTILLFLFPFTHIYDELEIWLFSLTVD